MSKVELGVTGQKVLVSDVVQGEERVANSGIVVSISKDIVDRRFVLFQKIYFGWHNKIYFNGKYYSSVELNQIVAEEFPVEEPE